MRVVAGVTVIINNSDGQGHVNVFKVEVMLKKRKKEKKAFLL